MSYMVDRNVHVAVVKGAEALDNVLACIKHKVASDSKKLKLLVAQSKVYTDRLNKIAEDQTLTDKNTFVRMCYAHLERIQGERKEIAERAKEQRRARELAEQMGMTFA